MLHLSMGTNVHLGSPVCIDRNNVTIGIRFTSTDIGDYLQRPSSDKLILSDSGIQLDLCHEDDDDLTDLNSYPMVEPKDRGDLTAMSPAYKDKVKIEPHLSSQGLDALGSLEKVHDSSSSESSGKSVVVHRSKGRPTKLANGVSVGGSGVTSSNLRGIIQCPVCNKMFNNSSALAKHKLIHSDERKYSCSVCSKAFKRQDHLNGHMMTHSSKKPYECKFLSCDKSYCDQRSLRRHIENHHQQYLDCSTPTSASEAALLSGRILGNSGESVFQFDSSFLAHFSGGVDSGSSGLLNSPVGISPTSASQKTSWPFGYNPLDEPKPVKCTVCDRRFKNLPALNGHMRLHGGFLKKDLTEAEKVNEDLDSSKPENCENRDPASKDSSHFDWPSSSEEINLQPESIHLKQEDEELNDQCYDLPNDLAKTDYSDYGLQTHNEDFKNQFFVDKQLLSSDTLPQMEDLKLKDNSEHAVTMGKDSELFIANSLVGLMDDPNVSDSGQIRCQRSTSDQQHAYADQKFAVSDNQHFSSLSFKMRSHGSGESKQIESTLSVTDQAGTTFGRYKMPGSLGNLTSQNLQSSSGSLLANNFSNPPTSHHLHKNPLNIKGRNHITRPLTSSYTMQRSYSSILPCPSSATFCGSSTPCTPHSPYPARAVYPATHNQPQTSSNSTFFEFPPRPGLVENGILSHPATPIHPGYGLSQQHTPHTPLSPYTPQPNAPYTPKNPTSSSRLSRFPFPPVSGLMESRTCESPYSHHHQKSTYHPYSHHHSQPSPHYTQRQQQQLKSQNFEQDVLEMDKEIEQRLQLLIQEDAKKMNSAQHLDPAPFVQPLESDLCNHQRSLGEVEQKPAPSSHLMASCLGLRQSMLGDVSTCGQNQMASQQMSSKRLDQEDNFLDEKMDQTVNDFDMDLELEPLNIRFSDQSIEQTPSELDVLELLLSDGQFVGTASEIAMDIPNVDIRSSHNEGTASHLASSFGTGSVASSIPSHSVVIAQGGDQHTRHMSSVQKWMNLESMSRFEMCPNVSKEEIFLNPNQLDGYKKKKHRPGPIIIPPCVNNFQTVTSHRYSSNVVECVRKTSILPSHPPPPYTALPCNSPADEGRGSFQMAFGNRAPQSAPTFHFTEARQMCDQSNEVMNREKEIFSWDQNVLDSFIDAEVQRFQDSSCYTPVSDGTDGDENLSQHLQSKNESTQDEVNRFGAASQNNLGHQEFGVWKLDEMNSYRQNLLEKGKNALR